MKRPASAGFATAWETGSAGLTRKLDIIVRKNRLLRYLRTHPNPIVLDHVAETGPRVARFIGHLLDYLSVWIVCRSDRRRDIGHVWENLYRFVRVEIPPFTERGCILN